MLLTFIPVFPPFSPSAPFSIPFRSPHLSGDCRSIQLHFNWDVSSTYIYMVKIKSTILLFIFHFFFFLLFTIPLLPSFGLIEHFSVSLISGFLATLFIVLFLIFYFWYFTFHTPVASRFLLHLWSFVCHTSHLTLYAFCFIFHVSQMFGGVIAFIPPSFIL